MEKITVQDMVKAGVHFGHQTKRWNPKMKPYIYGTRHGVTIFDLTVTMRNLAAACAFLRDTVADGGSVLFVGTKRQSQQVVREAAEETGMFYMSDRWLGGTLTNNEVIMRRTRYMKKLRKMEDDGEIDEMPNKEASSARRELAKLERTLSGIADMRKIPDVMVVVDIERDHIAVKEATRLGVTVVAIVDSNCDPDEVDYVVPGNDDAVRSINLLMSAFVQAVKEGRGLSGRAEEPSAGSDEAQAAGESQAAKAEPSASDEAETKGAETAPDAVTEATVEEVASDLPEGPDETASEGNPEDTKTE